jgi:hypothetical protein
MFVRILALSVACFSSFAVNAEEKIQPVINHTDTTLITQKEADWACSIVFVRGIDSFKNKLMNSSNDELTVNGVSASDVTPQKASCTVSFTLNHESKQKTYILTGEIKNLLSVKALGTSQKYAVTWLANTKTQE